MRFNPVIPVMLICSVALYACNKNTDAQTGCDPKAATTRQIISKKAVVKLTATATYPVYLVEEGSIDTKLIPCNFPLTSEYYQNDLQVIISGDVKTTVSTAYAPCCSENFVISSISK